MNENRILKVRFGFPTNSLYDLAYLSLDLYQLIVFCELLEQNDWKSISNFYQDSRSFALTRNSRVLLDFSKKVELKTIREGSIELIIAGVGVLASIIVPFVANSVTQKTRIKNERITFEISSEDNKLNQLIDEFGYGYFGRGEDAIKWLFETLNRKGYSLHIVSDNAYIITKTIERYEQRIIKIIKKN